jgi:hypothetical protein
VQALANVLDADPGELFFALNPGAAGALNEPAAFAANTKEVTHAGTC